VPRLAVLTLTTKVPDGATPQPNCRRNGTVLEVPAVMTKPLNDDEGPGIGTGDEVGSVTGTNELPVLEVGMSVGTLRRPRRSRNSNSNPRTDNSWSARKTSEKPAWKGDAVKHDGLRRKTGRTAAGSTVTIVRDAGVSVDGPVT
jgi:hypothetical protein